MRSASFEIKWSRTEVSVHIRIQNIISKTWEHLMCEAVFQLLIYTWVVGAHVDTIEKVVFFKKLITPPKDSSLEKLSFYLSVPYCLFFFLPGTNFHKSQANSLQTITHYKAKDDLEILMPLASLSRANTQAPISTLIYAVLLIQHGVSYAKQALYHLRNISIPILVKLDNILKPKF